MDIQQKRFHTVSHCVDLDNDNGKKVLVSVSICHINKCDGCDPSGEKGLHKASCAWNILTNETCQVHEINSKGCPIHDIILNKTEGPEVALSNQVNEKLPDNNTVCPNEEAKTTDLVGHEGQLTEHHEVVNKVAGDNEPTITLNVNKKPEEEKQVSKDNTSPSEPPDPPKDDGGSGRSGGSGGSGGSPLFIPSDGLLSPHIPLQDASNVQNMMSKPVLAESAFHIPTPVNIGTSLNFEQIQKQSGSTTCSYVYVDKIGENLSTRLPKIITEALASSTLHLKDEATIPECLYEPYQKITALTLEKIQQLKNKIYTSTDPSAHMSNDIYKVEGGEAIYIAGNESQTTKPGNSEERDSFLFKPENLITIENPNIEYSEENLAFEEIDEGRKKCPLCAMKETVLDANVASTSTTNKDADVYNSKTYECSYTNGAIPIENTIMDHDMGNSAAGKEDKSSKIKDLLIDQLSALSNTNNVNEVKRPKMVNTADFQHPLSIYNVSNRPYEQYTESLSNEKQMITPSKLLEENNLNTGHVNILTTHNAYMKSDEEEHSFLKNLSQTVDNRSNSCNCVKNKFHSCGHTKSTNLQGELELVSQMIQTDDVNSKHIEGEEEDQDEEELRAINVVMKKELSDENYKLLTHIIEKVRQNAAEISTVLKSHNMLTDSTPELLPIKESVKNYGKLNHSGMSRQRLKKKTLTYGSKLVLSPELPRKNLNEEIQNMQETERDRLHDMKDQSFFPRGKFSSLYVTLYKDIIRNSAFLKALIPPISSNGLFSDAVECHLNEQKRSLIPWLISLFIPTCECTTSKK